MATSQDVAASVAAAVEALALGPTRLPSDYQTNDVEITPGATRYQLRSSNAGRSADRVGDQKHLVAVEIVLRHYLSGAESDYLEGDDFDAATSSFTDLEWWRGLTDVFDVRAPGIVIRTTRPPGNVVVTSVSATLVADL